MEIEDKADDNQQVKVGQLEEIKAEAFQGAIQCDQEIRENNIREIDESV
jgi:hypothetical protein